MRRAVAVAVASAVLVAGRDATADKFDTETFFRTRGTFMGREMSVMEMKAYQQAWAVKRVQRLWRRAWDEAHP